MSGRASLFYLVAGGTGGHVFPAVALASYLEKKGHRVVFVTDPRATTYLASQGVVHTMPLHRRGGGLKGFWRFVQGLIRSTIDVYKLFTQAGRGTVMTYGGYPSLPAILAALMKRYPLYACEQDAVLGQVNRWFAWAFEKLFLGMPIPRLSRFLRSRAWTVGIAVRCDIANLNTKSYLPSLPMNPFVLTIVGGSQGARIFAEVVPPALALLSEASQKRLRLNHQCRADDQESLKSFYAQQGIQADVRPFFTDMAALYDQTHLFLGRAGASTVAEVIAAKRPALFVPFPGATHDHQTANAQGLVSQGAAWMMPQTELTPTALAQFLQEVMDNPTRLLEKSERLTPLFRKNVMQTVYGML
jgi:UDP-N-acetylglucosamine--N-acetylmuramyl-(pentapeptide) pyrophosphoryl-undecaprenol N-acetylglucosamine transferase